VKFALDVRQIIARSGRRPVCSVYTYPTRWLDTGKHKDGSGKSNARPLELTVARSEGSGTPAVETTRWLRPRAWAREVKTLFMTVPSMIRRNSQQTPN
jgi:hypothetical protein